MVNYLDEDGRVAQLVEQCPFKAWVAGSNPAALTIFFNDLAGTPFLALSGRCLVIHRTRRGIDFALPCAAASAAALRFSLSRFFFSAAAARMASAIA